MAEFTYVLHALPNNYLRLKRQWANLWAPWTAGLHCGVSCLTCCFILPCRSRQQLPGSRSRPTQRAMSSPKKAGLALGVAKIVPSFTKCGVPEPVLGFRQWKRLQDLSGEVSRRPSHATILRALRSTSHRGTRSQSFGCVFFEGTAVFKGKPHNFRPPCITHTHTPIWSLTHSLVVKCSGLVESAKHGLVSVFPWRTDVGMNLHCKTLWWTPAFANWQLMAIGSRVSNRVRSAKSHGSIAGWVGRLGQVLWRTPTRMTGGF